MKDTRGSICSSPVITTPYKDRPKPWEHTIWHDDGSWQTQLTYSPDHPFGVADVNYDATCRVSSEPMVNDKLFYLLHDARRGLAQLNQQMGRPDPEWLASLIQRVDAELRVHCGHDEPVSDKVGVIVLPARSDERGSDGQLTYEAKAHNKCLDAVAALNPLAADVAQPLVPDFLHAITENRISLTPEYEGQWHAEIFGDEAEPQFSAEAGSPIDAINAVLLEKDRAAFHQYLKSCASKVRKIRTHKHTCACCLLNAQPDAVCDCGAVVDGEALIATRQADGGEV